MFSGVSVALLPLNYAAFSVFLTPTFVLLAEAGAGDWHLAGLRIVNTVLGGLLGFAGSRLLWPSPEAARLPAYLAAVVRTIGSYSTRRLPDSMTAARWRTGRSARPAAVPGSRS